MTFLRTCLVALCVLSSAHPAWTQDAPAAPKVEPVLNHIPAGALGFVIIHDVKAVAAKTDKFIDDLGLGAMLSAPDPADKTKTKRISVLDMLRGAAQLGKGFNPRGGVAAVMLDPKAFDINLLDLLPKPGGPPAAIGVEGPTGEKPKVKLPFVIFVPGSGVKEVFGAYKMSPAGKHTLVELRMGPTYAAQLGGYVLLSPNDKALDAVLASKRKAIIDLPDEQVVMLAKSDLAYHVNMKVAGPIFTHFLKQAEEQFIMQAGPMAPIVSTYMGFYHDLFEQMETATVGVRLAPTGLVFEEMLGFKADSTFGKAVAAAKLTGRPPLNMLPDLPYALAVGGVSQNDAQSTKQTVDLVENLLKSEVFAGLADEEKLRFRTVTKGLTDQVTGAQIVVGGATAGKGLFGASFVIQCRSAKEVKALLAEKAKLAQALIHHFGKDEPKAQKLVIRYVKDVETVGSVSADAIVIEHPELSDMDEKARGELKKIIGEDKIRFLVASPNDKTVVVTFGGSRAFLVEALKAAGGAGKIGTSKADAQAIGHLPANGSATILLNGGNLFDLVVLGMKTMEPDVELPPFKITCKTPIAMGFGTTGKSVHIVFYVPTKLVKEVAGVVMMFTQGLGGGKAKPPVGGDDF